MATANCIYRFDVTMTPGREELNHGHHCTELVYYHTCSGRLISDGTVHHYRPGFFSVYQPGTRHADSPDTGGEQWCVGVTGCGARALPVGLWPADDGVRRAFELMHAEGSAAMPERMDILAGWTVLEIRRQLRIGEPAAAKPDYPALMREVINEHFSENINLDTLSERFFLSKSHMRWLFQAKYHETPLEYLIRRRIEVACELLTMTDLSIGEVARRVGLPNINYFSRLFRKRVGLSPSEFRRR